MILNKQSFINWCWLQCFCGLYQTKRARSRCNGVCQGLTVVKQAPRNALSSIFNIRFCHFSNLKKLQVTSGCLWPIVCPKGTCVKCFFGNEVDVTNFSFLPLSMWQLVLSEAAMCLSAVVFVSLELLNRVHRPVTSLYENQSQPNGARILHSREQWLFTFSAKVASNRTEDSFLLSSSSPRQPKLAWKVIHCKKKFGS